MTYNTREKWFSLERIWRLAHESPDQEYSISCTDRKEALKLRAALYACVRRARAGRHSNPDLCTIADTLAITLSDKSVVVYKRLLSPITKLVKESEEEEKMEKSLGKLKSQLSKLKPGLVIGPDFELDGEIENPYFKRED